MAPLNDSSENIQFELEYTRELPISLYYVWYEGHLHANTEILGLPAEPARGVYVIFENGMANVYTQKNNIEKLKNAINLLDHKKIENILNSYYSGFCKLKEDNSMIKSGNFIKELIGNFVITFILGDMPEHSLQKEAFDFREKTEQLFPEIYKSLKIMANDKELFEYYSYQELLNNEQVPTAVLSQRKSSTLFGEKIIPNLESDQKNSVDQVYANEVVKGNVACAGLVRGRVKIIMSKNQLNTIENGDVLVTNMTTPDFVPVLNKVSAIITDEGGITSHAAIIARELIIPCIIGTKNATKILKDGDEVEVDANQGIVKVIKN